MKNKFLFSLFVFTISLQAQFITGVAPLEIGNYWIYQEGDYLRVKFTVVGDTLINSVNYVVTSNSNFPCCPELFRLNDSGYYSRREGINYPGSNHEMAYYKHNADFGDYWSVPYYGDTTQRWHFEVKDTVTGIVFGKESQIKFISLDDSSGLWGFWQHWTDEFGMIFESADYAPDVYLRGCYIHGVAYGDTALTTDVRNENLLPLGFQLYQNFPNPFNPSTTISYAIPEYSKLVIKVFDILGNEITTLVNEEKPAGKYDVTWNAAGLPSGVYFYQLRTGSFVETKKLTLMK